MRCIACGCTDELPCTGQNTETGTCFWVWESATEQIVIPNFSAHQAALCSACAGKPIEELERHLNGVSA